MPLPPINPMKDMGRLSVAPGTTSEIQPGSRTPRRLRDIVREIRSVGKEGKASFHLPWKGPQVRRGLTGPGTRSRQEGPGQSRAGSPWSKHGMVKGGRGERVGKEQEV